MTKPAETSNTAFIPAAQILPEITCKAVVLSIILAVILAAANAYLGLKVGTTISASIPAAIISMGVLRLFRQSNILENNIVQTAASSGEALVAGIAYILPALIILQYWENFHYWESLLIAIIGGLLGVIFSVPLRRVLLSQTILRFPEGTAIGHVLKASTENKGGLKYLVSGGLVGGLISLFQGGFQLIADSIEVWFKAGNSFIYGVGCGFEPALLAAGYITGVNVAVSTLVGVILGWIIGVPVLTYLNGVPIGEASDTALAMWNSHIRYIGVGTMLVGGIWTLFTLVKPIIEGLRASFATMKSSQKTNFSAILRTERDLPIKYVLIAMLVLFIPLAILIQHYTGSAILQLSLSMQIITILIALAFIVFVGFAISAVSGYFAGLVGSTNSPGSGLMLSALLVISLIILILFGHFIHFASRPDQRLAAAGLAIIITTVIAAANVVTNETIQDLKAGQIVGATPWKQQFMMMIGVVVAAFVIPPILQLLFNAYGIGGVFPRAGMDPSQMLAAPQAGLMAALAQGVFTDNLPWNMIITGAIVAIFSIIIDHLLRKKGASLPVLAVGLGIYLPLDASLPLIIGGIASYFIERAVYRKHPSNSEADQQAIKYGRQNSLILACGIVAGSALMGVILAIPFAIAQSTDVLKLASDHFAPFADGIAIIVTMGLLIWLHRAACKSN